MTGTPTIGWGRMLSMSKFAREKLSDARLHIADAVTAVRELDQVSPADRRGLNAAIDDVEGEIGRVRVALQRAMERTTEEPS